MVSQKHEIFTFFFVLFIWPILYIEPACGRCILPVFSECSVEFLFYCPLSIVFFKMVLRLIFPFKSTKKLKRKVVTEKAISINMAVHEKLFIDSDSAQLFKVDCLLEISNTLQ